MKPFDLEAALRGEPVMTRTGDSVGQLTKFDVDGEFVLAGVIEGVEEIQVWTAKGKFLGEHEQSDNDLFMASKTIKRWVNFYSDGSVFQHTTENQAKDFVNCKLAIAIAVPVEFEEGYGK